MGSRHSPIVMALLGYTDCSRVQCETTEGGLRGNRLLFKTAGSMWTHGGMRAYYRGLTLGLLGIVPYSAIDLGCFEGMKRAYRKARMKSRNCSYDAAEPGNISHCSC
jgi:solute carrier family 25 phosphate transporter 23/24/25/41